MQRRQRLAVLAGGLALLIAGTGGVIAHKGASGIVKQRMEAMKAMGSSMKSVAAMVTGKTAYDAAKMKKAATLIKAHAQKTPKMFPKGSTNHPSEAKPEIWARWSEFEVLAKRLASYADALDQAAGNQKGVMAHKMTPAMMSDPEHLKLMPPKMIFIQISKTCSTCHKDFRKPKKKK